MAQPQPDSNDGQSNKLLDQEDRDFDPTAEALIDDIDDERTLEEEEALDAKSGAAVQEELDDLKRESEMPIEELLAYYERMRQEVEGAAGSEEEYDTTVDLNDHTENKSSTSQNQAEASPSVNLNDHERNQLQLERSSDSNKPGTATSQPEKMACGVSSSISHNHESEITSNQEEQIERKVSLDEESSAETTTPEKPKHSMSDFIIEDGSGVFKTLLGYDLDDSDDMDGDYSYTDDEYEDDDRGWKRSIHVGPEHQADVPEGLSHYDGLPPYENKDILVWKCASEISHASLITYLKEASSLSRTDISISSASVPKISSDGLRTYRERSNDVSSSSCPQVSENENENSANPFPDTYPNVYMSQSRKRMRIDYELAQENAFDGVNQVCISSQGQFTGSREDNSSSTSQDTKPELSTEEYFQDEEQLLYLLLQCNYNFDEAMRRRKLDPFKYYLYEPMSLWSQEECLSFEDGLRTFGKDFRSIRENKVQTRTHAEVVAFYYLWKKSERHDVYTNQYKLDRKRSLSHPGTTDYMDRFIEDNESIANASSSSTPTPLEVSSGSNASASAFRDLDQPISSTHGLEQPQLNDCNENSNDFARSRPNVEISLPIQEGNSDLVHSDHIDSNTHT